MSRYQTTPGKSTDRGAILSTTRYIEIPLSEDDIYVITTIGDKYDTLALQYYQRSSMWFIIAMANPQLPKDTLIPPPGVQLRIPDVSTAFSIANQYGNY